MKKFFFNLFKLLCERLYGKGLWRFSLMRSGYYFLFNLFGPKGKYLLDYKGVKFYVDADDVSTAQGFIVRGGYENLETELFYKAVKKGMVVLDVGANVGLYSLLAAKKAGKTGKVFAFEPVPANYSYLEENINLNGFEKIIHTYSLAVSDKTSSGTKLYLARNSSGYPSFSNDNIMEYSRSGSIDVSTTTMDQFFDNVLLKTGIKSVDIIKVDVEGAEFLVFSKADKILSHSKNVQVFMEYWPTGIRNVGGDPVKLLDKFKKAGFRFFSLNEFTNKIQEADMDEVIKDAENRWILNLIMKR